MSDTVVPRTVKACDRQTSLDVLLKGEETQWVCFSATMFSLNVFSCVAKVYHCNNGHFNNINNNTKLYPIIIISNSISDKKKVSLMDL